MKAIVVEKKETQSEINKMYNEKKNKAITVKFVCTSSDEVINNGFQDIVKDVNFKTHNVIILE